MTRAQTLFPKDRIILRELGLRDGLQLTKQFPTTDAKREWIEHEFSAGVRHFEIGSFLPNSRFPQFSDLRKIIDTVDALDGAFSTALTLNERGVTDALTTSVDEILFVVSATESHSQANTNRSRDDAIKMLTRVDEQRNANRSDPPVLTAGIAMSFGCSLEGAVDQREVLRMAEAALTAGADALAIADTVGFGGPLQVSKMAQMLRSEFGDDQPISMHFHDTRGLAIANCAAALDNNIRILDGCLAGLGGCPFAPGATGNTVFEDMVFLCETMGFDTGIDVSALAAARSVLESSMPDEPVHGALARAGVPQMLENI